MQGGDEPIHRYDNTLAEAKEILFRLLEIETDSIFYAKYFVSGDKGFNSEIKGGVYKMCMVIITDDLILVIYNLTKVVFKLEIKKIKRCSVHFIENKYILAFILVDDHIKGFKLDEKYAKVACEIHDLFSDIGIMKNIRAVYTIARPGNNDIKNEEKKEEEKQDEEIKNEEEEKLDKSSYEKTLVENDSVITFDNDKNINEKINLDGFGNNLKNLNEIQTNSSRNQFMSKNNDVYLEVKDYK